MKFLPAIRYSLKIIIVKCDEEALQKHDGAKVTKVHTHNL